MFPFALTRRDVSICLDEARCFLLKQGRESSKSLMYGCLAQAVAFLVCPNKGALSLEDIASNLCPALNSQQIYRLCTTFHEDNGCSMDMVSGEVLEGLKSATTGGVHNNGGLIVTFLIDDDHNLIIAPHGSTVEEVLQVINRKELYGPLPLCEELDTESCPRSVFAWLESPVQMPALMERLSRR
ncbi:hypothetical protein DUNSADRAFT_18590 [Dunaliella salina]|uniref:Dilute domain-containing protein n=1 Tax=Dunaliella salina TaxID=3046 RepID=A0ABQ7FZV8_DUNSA|nr:hypothetical protein DUNSADRAFT_18590 [Dunaliella salina]|eukprot:KAF5827887.1 hypothetical protein DUNSADRAFT_18590 [Dunaliella salina]